MVYSVMNDATSPRHIRLLEFPRCHVLNSAQSKNEDESYRVGVGSSMNWRREILLVCGVWSCFATNRANGKLLPKQQNVGGLIGGIFHKMTSA